MSRRYYYVAGIVLFAAAIVELAAPNALGLPFGNLTAAILGAATLLYAISILRKRRRQPVNRSDTPDVELTRPTAVPGKKLTDVLNTFPDVSVINKFDVRAGFEQVVVTVLSRYGDYSKAEAEAAVSKRTWTDDSVAAEYVSPDSTDGSVRERLRGLVDRGSEDNPINRTTDALLAVAGLSTADHTKHNAEFDFDDIEATTVDPGVFESDDPLTLGRRRLTRHWFGVGTIALVCLGVGVLTRSAGVLLGASVGVGYVAYARAHSLNEPALSLERTVGDRTPEPGDEVELTLRVTNDGSSLLADVRLIDGVPDSLAVTDGSPRLGTTLRPGETATLSYTVTVGRGRHEFSPAMVLVRNLPGSVERTIYLSDETTIECLPSIRPVQQSVPLRSAVTGLPGQIETETGGSGITFQTIREYQPGDPLSRIDWNYRARTGELATVDFRQQRSASVVLLIDARVEAYIGPTPAAAHAVDRSVAGASRIFERLLDDGNQAGIAAMGDADCWLAPGTGSEHRERARELFGTSTALSPNAPEGRNPSVDWLRQLRQRLTPGTQLLVFSPLCEPATVLTLQNLDARGFPVTIISPDPTGTETSAQKLVGLRRALTLSKLRRASIPVIDWQPSDPLEALFRGQNA
jgi:uncharacterized repeat protein (TIGR01451 family)